MADDRTPAPGDDPAAALEEWNAIEKAATPGPWEVFSRHGRDIADEGWSECFIAGGGATIALTYLTSVIETDDDGVNERFIVTARTAMPRLLAAIGAVLAAAGKIDRHGLWIPDEREPDGGKMATDMLRESVTRALAGEEAGAGDA